MCWTTLPDDQQIRARVQAGDALGDVVAGRPSMGKTSLAVNIAYDLAVVDTPVGYFSLAMSREQFGAMMIARRLGVG